MRTSYQFNGLSRLAEALMGGAGTRNSAYANESYRLAGAKNQLASAMENEAQARKYQAEADQIANRPAQIVPFASNVAGMTMPQGAQVADYLKTGSWGKEQAPHQYDQFDQTDIVSGLSNIVEAAQPGFVNDANLRRFQDASAAYQANLGGTGNTTADKLIAALGGLREMGIKDDAMGGKLSPEQVNNLGRASAAIAGKAIYHDTGGRVLDQFTGGLDESGATAQAGIDLSRTKEKTEKSKQAENYAQAGLANARAKHVGTEAGAKPSGDAWQLEQLTAWKVKQGASAKEAQEWAEKWLKTSKSKDDEAIYAGLLQSAMKDSFGNTGKARKLADEAYGILMERRGTEQEKPTQQQGKPQKSSQAYDEYKAAWQQAIDAGRKDLADKITARARQNGVVK